MLTLEYNEEVAKRVEREEAMEEGRAAGRLEGRLEGERKGSEETRKLLIINFLRSSGRKKVSGGVTPYQQGYSYRPILRHVVPYMCPTKQKEARRSA